MTSKSIHAPLADRKAGDGAGNKTASLSIAALLATVFENLRLLLLGPVIVALVTFGVVSVLPQWYTSVAYLKIDEAGARTADALMHSPPVLDKVLTGFKPPQNTVEARRAFIAAHRRIVVASGEIQTTPSLHRLEYSDRDPHVAQMVNSLFIDAWLDATKPTPEQRMKTEDEIARRELGAKSVSELLDRLQRDASLASKEPIASWEMIQDRDKNLATIESLRSSLNVSREMVFSAPDLPAIAYWPKKGVVTVLAGFAAEVLLLIFVILRRFSSV